MIYKKTTLFSLLIKSAILINLFIGIPDCSAQQDSSKPISHQMGKLGSPKTIPAGKGQPKTATPPRGRAMVVKQRIVKSDKPIPPELRTRVRLHDVTAYVTEKQPPATVRVSPETDTQQNKPKQSPFSVKFSKEVLEVIRDSTDGKDENPWLLFMNAETGVVDKATNLYAQSGEDWAGFE